MEYNNRSNKINTNILIVGLGYVGLPLIKKFVDSKKYKVMGLDTDKKKIDLLRRNKSYISHIPDKQISVINKNCILTNNYKFIKRADVIIFTLPTPISKNKDPDMSFIQSALTKSKNFFKKDKIIILESTVYPGATIEYFKPIFNDRKLKIGKDIFLGFSPEREDPGNKNFDISNIVKLVSGYTPKCLSKCDKIYKSIGVKTKRVSSINTAEITKLYENIFRSVNIGLVNEMKLIADKMNLDIYEIIDAAKTKPFGFTPFYPGPGLGGHCIPIDPYLLTWKARQYDLNTKFVELSADINNSMPTYVIDKINNGLNYLKKNFSNSKILIVGLSYKKNVDDIRESPSIKIIENLVKKNAKIFYHDNYIKTLTLRVNKNKLKLNSVNLNKKTISSFDLVCIVTDHDYIDYKTIEKFSKIIVDCRGRFKKKKDLILQG